MENTLKVAKMQGLGNDFIIIDNRDGKNLNYSELAKKLCRRMLSIGADGLGIIENSDEADIAMRIINSDGSEAGMCGNLSRCFAKYVYEQGIVKKERISVQTKSGIVYINLIVKNGKVELVRVNMGRASFSRAKIPMVSEGSALNCKLNKRGYSITVHGVLLGNPHCVTFVDDISDCDFENLGPALECDPTFPEHANVHFVQIIDRNYIKIRTWERGAGPTLACGTGSCACVAVGRKLGVVDELVSVENPAGVLAISYFGDDLIMTGPAEYVFFGEAVL